MPRSSDQRAIDEELLLRLKLVYNAVQREFDGHGLTRAERLVLGLFQILGEAILPIELLWEHGHDWATAPLLRQDIEALIDARVVRYRKAPARRPSGGKRRLHGWVPDARMKLRTPGSMDRLALRYATFGAAGGFGIIDSMIPIDLEYAERLHAPFTEAREGTERKGRDMTRYVSKGRTKRLKLKAANWAGCKLTSTQARAEYAGLASAYHLCFRLLSEHTHAGFGRLASVLESRGSGVGPRREPEPIPALRFTLAAIWWEYLHLLARLRPFDMSACEGLLEPFGYVSGATPSASPS